MVDPISAFALAATIAQFIEVGFKTLHIFQQLWEHATTDENQEIEIVIRDMGDVCAKLASPSRHSTVVSRDDKTLQALVQKCQTLSKELDAVLQKLMINSIAQDWKRGFETMGKALRSMMKADKIKNLQKRIGDVRDQLVAHMIYTLTDRQSEMFQKLEEVVSTSQKQSSEISKSLLAARDEAQRACEDQKCQAQKLEQSIGNIGIATKGLQDAVVRLMQLSEQAAAAATSTTILKSLQYASMTDRCGQIDERHPRTLSWLFESATSSFKAWLEQGSGAFWISGKAGSGKSTLMKYLTKADQTEASLRTWAGQRQLFTASFYFWFNGTRMQQTQEGLLRSMLHEILRQEPSLIPKVVSDRYRKDTSFHQHQTWTLPELYAVLDTIVSETPTACFCFFIDGLDEYSGDAGQQGQFAEKILKLASSKMVKVCVSSRPWTAFENVFGGDLQQMLVVEDFTRDDMARFVKDTLVESHQFATVLRQDRPRAMALVHEIQDRAQGVFLWVTMVVRSLLSGATQEDSLDELTTRLRALPRDLKGFFQRMLDSVDDNYEIHASRILLIAQCFIPLPLMAFSWVRLEIERPDYAVVGNIEERDNDNRRKRQARVFLNKLSKDLLTVYDSSWKGDGTGSIDDLKIGFCHRTVGEFLKEPDVKDTLLAKAGPDFDPHRSICRLLLAEAKTVRMSDDPQKDLDMFEALARRLVYYAKEYEDRNQSALPELLWTLDTVITARLSRKSSPHWTTSTQVAHPRQVGHHRKAMSHSSSNFLAYAVENDLIEFVRETLDSSPGLLKKPGRPLLDYAIYPSFPRDEQSGRSVVGIYPLQMIELLLNRGSLPNQHATIKGAMTVWQLFLLDQMTVRQYPASARAGAWEVAQLLLKHGANPRTKVPIREKLSVILHDSCNGEDMDIQRTSTEEVGVTKCLEFVTEPEALENFLSDLPEPNGWNWRSWVPWIA